MQQRRSKTVLSIGFGFILVLILAMTFGWLSFIDHASGHIEQIIEEQNEAKFVFKMRDSAHQRSHLLYRIALLDDVFERDEIYIKYKQLASDFIAAKDALVDMGISEDEKRLWEQARSLIIKGRQSQVEAVELLLAKKDELAKNILLDEITPSHEKVLAELTSMLEFYHLDTQKAVDEAVLTNAQTYHLVIVLGCFIFLVGLAVAYYAVSNSTLTENELIELQQSAESASHSKSLFLANMSHEIRTPLTAIIGYAETMQEGGMSQSEGQDYINTILRNGRHLLTVINDILDLSKIEANKLDVDIIEVSPLSIVNEIESVMGHIASDKGLALKIDYQFPIPRIIASDPTRLKQILLNLLSNAIKFTEKGSVSLSCEFNSETNQMIFTTTDTGVGMSKEVMNRIFSPFSQADASTTRKYGGTGLGLTISRQLANMLGGDLTCESEKDKGARFILTIYAGWIESEDLYSCMPSEDFNAPGSINSKTAHIVGEVLVAEDSPDVRSLVSMYLTRAGATVTAVENGKIAVEEALANDFDLILMDMQMPVMDGVQATEWLRSTGYGGNIIAFTANSMKEERDHYTAVGINDFIGKPLDLKQFYQVVSKYLRSGSNEIVLERLYDEEMQELIIQFIDGLPGTLQVMTNATSESDLVRLAQESHKLKGMGGSFGFPEITEIAKKIESHAKSNEIDIARVFVSELEKVCADIIAEKMKK